MSKGIATIGEIFSTTWDQYKQRALPILAVILISTAFIGGLIMIMVLCATFSVALLSHFIDEGTSIYIIIILVSVLVLIITILAIWCQTAMLAILVDEELGIIEAFQTGWGYLWPMAWVLTILSGILITGFVVGFLPGILFMVWFTFCLFILLDEDRRGLDALLASKNYVHGYWWNTFAKLLIIWLISTVIGLVPFVGQVFSILFAPFFMLFMLAMYRDLKNIKGEAEVAAVGSGSRIFWWIVAGVGLILPLLALIGAMMTLLSGEYEWMEFTRQSMHGKWI